MEEAVTIIGYETVYMITEAAIKQQNGDGYET